MERGKDWGQAILELGKDWGQAILELGKDWGQAILERGKDWGQAILELGKDWGQAILVCRGWGWWPMMGNQGFADFWDCDLKTPFPFLVILFWVIVVFAGMSRAPVSPEPFPESEDLMLARSIYNPELGAALGSGLRDFWQKPDQVLETLGDLEGLTIADIGCGEGYFTSRLLELVGPEGKVFATDIQPEVLATFISRTPEYLLNRVEPILSTPEDVGIDQTVDVILMVQVLGELENQRAFLDQIGAIMHDQSRLAIIDSKHLTDPVNGYTRPLNLNALLNELYLAGFEPDPSRDSAIFDFLPKQFFFILKKRPEI